MCGIAGVLRLDRSSPSFPKGLFDRMANALAHRGPDGSGHYTDTEIGLCHRRLSVIDPSDAGRQPMVSADGRYVVVYNGEIYNYRSLRTEMEREGVRFDSETDTEVLLALYALEGRACLKRLNGMFAFAIWDTRARSLFLARDRLGKKPLYIFRARGLVGFASEIRALRELPGFEAELRPDAVRDFFQLRYVPDPKSIFRQITKLPPSAWMYVERGRVSEGRYWELTFRDAHWRSEAERNEQLLDLLEDSVRLRMVSDVPLGAFLSGGVDSSAIVALMSRHSEGPVKTCSIGFDSREHDEIAHARTIARAVGSDHHEFSVDRDTAVEAPAIASWFDEPFADPSLVPTWFVSKLARRVVTVALSGDGGDESFAGYAKYALDRREHRLRAHVPQLARRALPLAGGLLSYANGRIARRARSLVESIGADPARALAISNRFFDPVLWKRLVRSEFAHETSGYDPDELTTRSYHAAPAEDHLARVLYADITTYLPGDILVKVDRMSMAHSLETRSPLLDYRLVELAARIPSRMKLDDTGGKRVLKQALAGVLDSDTLARRKRGFDVPLARWIRHDLCEAVETELLRSDGGLAYYFRPDKLRALWDDHRLGRLDATQELWSLFVFGRWWQRWVADGSR